MRLLLLALLLCSLPRVGSAVAPEYRISQLYLAAAPLPELPLARHFDAAARIVSPSWRLEPAALRTLYDHPQIGPQIRTLLEGDPLVSWALLDRFLRGNFPRLQRVSFYREGFVTLQYVAPQTTVIVPLSLSTVVRGEEAVRHNLPLMPELFR